VKLLYVVIENMTKYTHCFDILLHPIFESEWRKNTL